MSTRRDWLIRTASASVAAMTARSSLWAASPPGSKPLVVGQSVPLTGAASEIGLAFAAGSKLYVDAFNARPDTPRRIDLRPLDDGYDAARAGANARKLLADGADLLFGFVGTASSKAGADVARSEGAVLLAPFAASDALRDGSYPQVFHVRASMADEAFKMVRHCTTIGQTRIAVMAEDDAMGRAGLEAVNKAIAELKLAPLVGSAFVPSNSAKVDEAVATLSALKPQAIIQVSLFNTTAAFIRQMRKTGYSGSFMNFSVVGIDPLFTALGKEINGVVVSQVVPAPRDLTRPVVREYLAAIETSDQTPTYESLEGFIAAKALGEAVRRSGGAVTRATMQRTLSGMNDYDVGGYQLHLRAGVRESAWAIELVSIRSDGRLIR